MNYYQLYEQTARRLARKGINDPTRQIIALTEEIEHYRAKIMGLEAMMELKHKARYTQYDPDLDRFVAPFLVDPFTNKYTTLNVHIDQVRMEFSPREKSPIDSSNFMFGEVIDRLAEYENAFEYMDHKEAPEE